MRVALRGAYVSRFTVSPPAISNFFWGAFVFGGVFVWLASVVLFGLLSTISRST